MFRSLAAFAAATVFAAAFVAAIQIAHAQEAPTQSVPESTTAPPRETTKVLPLPTKGCPPLSQAEIDSAAQAIKEFRRNIPEEIQQLLLAWLGYSKFYRIIYYAVATATIFFGALATALADEAAWWKRWKTMAAVCATIAAGLSTTLAPYGDFKKFDQAFVVLNVAKTAYLTNPTMSLCDVGNAVATGEAVIHRGE